MKPTSLLATAVRATADDAYRPPTWYVPQT